MDKEERRRSERKEIKVQVLSENSRVIKGVNFNAHGVQVMLKNPMKVGQITDIQFCTPDQPYYYVAKSVVVWQKSTRHGYFTGLEFQKVRPILRMEKLQDRLN